MGDIAWNLALLKDKIPLTFPKQALVLTCLHNRLFENTEGKGESAHNEQFSPFPARFSTSLEKFLPFLSNLKLLSANSFSLEKSKIVVWERVNRICKLDMIRMSISNRPRKKNGNLFNKQCRGVSLYAFCNDCMLYIKVFFIQVVNS